MRRLRGMYNRVEQGERINKTRRQPEQKDSIAAAKPLGGFLVPLLFVLVVVTSLAVVDSSHRARQLFSELQDLHRDAMNLDEEWGRLLLEQSTWASPDRVQRLSENKLQMRPPAMSDVNIVRNHD